MRMLSPNEIRSIRTWLGMSRKEFGHILWAALTTVEQWETGECVPVGAHRRLLELLARASVNPDFKLPKQVNGSPDPLLVLYKLLETLYASETHTNM